jgi:DNA-binding NarL/FixJ family response regulator
MSRRPLHATGQGHRVRVALVDDHVLLLDGLSARLSRPRTGVEVVATSPTWNGLIRDDRFPDAFDVVVLDLALRDDVPVAQKIRTLAGVGLTSVLLSTHADASTIHGAMRAGASAVVPKAESSEELIATIHAAADGTPRQTALVQQAMQDFHAEEDPRLGQQEQRALVLYAGGRSIRDVAEAMSTTEETVKSYIKRARRKYLHAGTDLGTKVLLRRHAIRHGWIAPE